MRKRGFLLAGTLTCTIILAGCFQGEETLEDIDAPPNEAEEVDSLEEVGTEEEAGEEAGEEGNAAETVARQLYLIDANGMVASQTVELPTLESKEVATQVMEHLVKGGPVTNLLPNGFQAVLPEGTEINGLSLQEDGTMIVDVSEEFKNYRAEDELKILQAVTHTLTQFDSVENVKLRIEGVMLEEMPVNGTPIGDGYSRANGINLTNTGAEDLMNATPVTMYYPAEHEENQYYVPVTQYVEGSSEDIYQSVVQSLIDGPSLDSNLTQVFSQEVTLVEEPTLTDGVLELNFNDEVLTDREQAVISDEVMQTLVRTLTEQRAVEAVSVEVENVEQLVNESGEAYEEPVTKQALVPTGEL
ncbi:GerMN domain-containing protein [Lentibacillus sediminis]|uniref:GerMN domain-containing protein n=1 Tax=Lentibacillus sediminis TaxID=1940529 RepID=UPI000C1C66D1|nr:GerMN domain-containing protein [Lentibacillus sediminis]